MNFDHKSLIFLSFWKFYDTSKWFSKIVFFLLYWFYFPVTNNLSISSKPSKLKSNTCSFYWRNRKRNFKMILKHGGLSRWQEQVSNQMVYVTFIIRFDICYLRSTMLWWIVTVDSLPFLNLKLIDWYRTGNLNLA